MVRGVWIWETWRVAGEMRKARGIDSNMEDNWLLKMVHRNSRNKNVQKFLAKLSNKSI